MYLDMDGINMTISGASVVPPMRGANILRFTTAVSTTNGGQPPQLRQRAE
jgi:hypothetical protein